MTERTGNPRLPMVLSISGGNNRLSPSSIYIPLIRLKGLPWRSHGRLTGHLISVAPSHPP
jgi:hypothetical protein